MHRRLFLASGAGALLAARSLVSSAQAQTAPASAPVDAGEAVPFSFDWLTEEMKKQAQSAYSVPQITLPEAMQNITYDEHRAIRFRRDHVLWKGESPFELQAFHPGWLFKQPVTVNVVRDGMAAPIHFNSDMFSYDAPLDASRFQHIELPGVAGFRLHYPLNDPQVMDELVSFLGASYFRALGRGNFYGLSARGLAVNTATSRGEEFPVFREFWIDQPTRESESITLYAALDSESVTGAYKFIITPGKTTGMAVTARLFIRKDIERLGVAPATSMFLFAENNRADFDDYRGKVHDSDGLKIVRADGQEVWRSLNNPRELASSMIGETSPKSYGLVQRDRSFDHYQDAEAGYERRPSLMVETVGDWGRGTVCLIELPTDLEVNDNIVAFWVPEGDVKAGQELEFQYNLIWGNIDEPQDKLARVVALRSGKGGTSGVESKDVNRKFVLDFAGDPLRMLSENDVPVADVDVRHATVQHMSLSRVNETDQWRLVIDLIPEGNVPIEMRGILKLGDTVLSETWTYQWRFSDVRR